MCCVLCVGRGGGRRQRWRRGREGRRGGGEGKGGGGGGGGEGRNAAARTHVRFLSCNAVRLLSKLREVTHSLRSRFFVEHGDVNLHFLPSPFSSCTESACSPNHSVIRLLATTQQCPSAGPEQAELDEKHQSRQLYSEGLSGRGRQADSTSLSAASLRCFRDRFCMSLSLCLSQCERNCSAGIGVELRRRLRRSSCATSLGGSQILLWASAFDTASAAFFRKLCSSSLPLIIYPTNRSRRHRIVQIFECGEWKVPLSDLSHSFLRERICS